MTLERFTHLLDAYGGRIERWPEHERPAAQALLQRSVDARARAATAARLDALLDQIPEPAPSPALIARVLATAPSSMRRPPARRWRSVTIAATGGLAVAASVALWLVRAPGPTAGAPLGASAIAQLGVLDVPTDALLSETSFDLGTDTPAFGCDDPALGCDEPSPEPDHRSGRLTGTKEMPA